MAQTINFHNEGATDPTLVASWRTRTFGAGTVPIASGVVYFAGGNDRVLGGTTLDATLAYVGVTRNFGGSLGGSGLAMTIGVNTNGGATYPNHIFSYAAGGGEAYVTCGTGGIGTVKVDSMGKLFLTGGTPGKVEVSAGLLDINNTTDLSTITLDIMGGRVDIDYKADATDPTINIWPGATLLIRRAGGTFNVYGGTVILQVEKEQNAAATINLQGGTIDWRSGDLATALTAKGGTIRFDNAIAPIDLSAATVTLGQVSIPAFTAGAAKVKWPTTITNIGTAPAALRTGNASA